MKEIYYLIHSINFGDTLCATPTLRYLSQSHRKKINVVNSYLTLFTKIIQLYLNKGNKLWLIINLYVLLTLGRKLK